MTSSNLSSSELPPPLTASRKRSWAPRWLIVGSISVLLLGGGFFLWRLRGTRVGNAMQFPPAVTVNLEAVQVGRIQDSSEFLGSLEAQTRVFLQPEVSGRVVQISVTEGDRVNPGDPIVLISSDRMRAEVLAAEASVNAAEENVTAAAANVTASEASVIAAQAARDAAAASLESLKARRPELRAELTLQEGSYRRTASLVEQGALAQEELDRAERDLDVAEANIQSAEQEIAAAEANVAQAEATLAQANAALAQARANRDETQANRDATRANRDATQENLDDRTVTAPIAGIVGDFGIKLGDYVSPNIVLTSITENATLKLGIEIPIELRDRLRLGLPVELMADNGEEVLARGSIIFISPQANASTQTVLVKAQFENPNNRLQDSQRVEARLIWDDQEQGVLVPTTAVTRIGGETFVYVAESGNPDELPPPEAVPPGIPVPEQVARLRPIELGNIQGNNYQVLQGLEPGETIVVSGILNLRDGIPILPQATAANQAN